MRDVLHEVITSTWVVLGIGIPVAIVAIIGIITDIIEIKNERNTKNRET